MKLSWYIEQGNFQYRGMVEKMLGYSLVETPEEADVILFTGGADVNPELYHHMRHPTTFSAVYRDALCQELFLYTEQKLYVGICRGGQFLHVMNGGKMAQDVNNHAIRDTHEINLLSGVTKTVSSTHHQMMLFDEETAETYNGILVGWSDLSTRKIVYDETTGEFENMKDRYQVDAEIIYYTDTKSLCFQPHPEFAFDTKKFEECFEVFRWSLDNYLLD